MCVTVEIWFLICCLELGVPGIRQFLGLASRSVTHVESWISSRPVGKWLGGSEQPTPLSPESHRAELCHLCAPLRPSTAGSYVLGTPASSVVAETVARFHET